VALATRHGILTPYTSFLADENTNVNDLAGNSRRAGSRLDELATADGRSGFVQREFKGSMQKASMAPAASAPMPAAEPSSSPGHGAGMGGYGFGAMANGLAPAEREAQQAAQTIRNVGNRTFYQRNNQWVDSALTEAQQKDPIRVKQFSDEYFELTRRHGREVSQYLVFDEPVLLAVEGRTYLIEP
ncbi:MAG: hypothetical protein JW719_06860, partial [Pirellulales bacterium]|nr:hypothetical protein [Pirellulales bacterium]